MRSSPNITGDGRSSGQTIAVPKPCGKDYSLETRKTLDDELTNDSGSRNEKPGRCLIDNARGKKN